MGVGGAARAISVAASFGLAVGLALSPLAWHQAAVAASAALLSFALPGGWRAPVLALALAAALSSAPLWLLGALVPVIGLLAVLVRRSGEPFAGAQRALAAAGALAAGAGVVGAIKQLAAMRELPAAAEGVGPSLLLGAAAAGGALYAAVLPAAGAAPLEDDARGLSMVHVERAPLATRLRRALTPERALALGLLVAGAGTAGRLARLSRLPGADRLAAAAEIDAVGLVYPGVLAEAGADRVQLLALVKAAPLRDDAAIKLGVEPALAAGWRPQRAEGRVVETAQALERAGRGGEALRLLDRHPREGAVDGLRALFERTQGLPVDWRGGAFGPEMPPSLSIDQTLTSDGKFEVAFTLREDRPELTLLLDGDAWNGPPAVDVVVDAPVGVSSLLEITGPTRVPLGALEAGPHRVSITFINDAAGPGGDRNVRVLEITD